MDSSLIFRIKEIQEQPNGLDIEIQFSPEKLSLIFSSADVKIEKGFFECKGTFLALSEEQIEFRGKYRLDVTMPCHRCLESAHIVAEQPMQVIFLPKEHSRGRDEERLDAPFDLEEGDVVYHNHEFLDLGPILRECILLAVPMSILCKEDCLGLCPMCGENRNITACTCKLPTSFSPFAELKNLSKEKLGTK